MDIFPKIKSMQTTPKHLLHLSIQGITWGLIILPFVIYVTYVLRYSLNIPYWDDFYTTLNFINNLSTSGHKAAEILNFSLNGHRIIFNNIIVYLQYLLWRRINFTALIIFGNIGWVLGATVLAFKAKRDLGLSIIYLVPLVNILMTFTHWQSMFFATPSIQFYWTVLFTVIFLLFLEQRRFIPLYMSFLFGAFTSGAGLALYPLGSSYFFIKKAWKAFLIFLSFGLLIILYYFSNNRYFQGEGILSTLRNPLPAIKTLFAAMGAYIQKTNLTVIFGALGIIVFIILFLLYILRKRKEGDYWLLLTSFSIFAGAIVSVYRVDLGFITVIRGYYTIFSILFWASLYVLTMILLKSNDPWRKIALAGAIILSSIGFYGMLAYQEYEGNLENFASQKQISMIRFMEGDPSKLMFPSPEVVAPFIETSVKNGIYIPGYHRIPVKQINLDSYPEAKDAIGGIEPNYDQNIFGLLIVPGFNPLLSVNSVLLSNQSATYEVPTVRFMRPDVKQYFGHFTYQFSGFECFYDLYEIPPGTYRIGIILKTFNKAAYKWTDYYLTIPSK
jgi:hypothetical protein